MKSLALKSLLTLAFVMLLLNLAVGQVDEFSAQLSAQLKDEKIRLKLNFPNSVKEFYHSKGYQPVWIIAESNARNTWAAMILLDCVSQYGLNHQDYHAGDLTYEDLNTMMSEQGKAKAADRVRFEIFLTDAMLSLLNNLHYGKLNPYFVQAKIDNLPHGEFSAVSKLVNAMSDQDFTTAVSAVQPKSIQYVYLQNYMRLIRGQYVGDAYVITESEVHKIAINMERLRWAEFNRKKRVNTKPYLTCRIKNGLPVYLKDFLNLDQKLETAMFFNKQPEALSAEANVF